MCGVKTNPIPAFQLLRPIAKTALYWKDSEISYYDLLAHSAALASLYFSMPGERVMIFAENRPEWISALYSIWRNHCIVVPVDMMSPADEVLDMLNQTTPLTVFCSTKTRAVLDQALQQFPADIQAPRLIDFDEADFPAFPTGALPSTPIPAGATNDLAAILFTSGTTGASKGVMLTFGNLLTNLESVCHRVPIFKSETRTFALLPFHHILPLMGSLIAPLYSGGAMVMAHSLDPAEMVATMKRHKATILIGVPRLYALLRKAIMENLNRSSVGRGLYKLSAWANRLPLSRVLLFPVQRKFGGKLYQMVSGGAPLEREVARDLTVCGFQVLEGYGMTEAAPMIAFPRPGKVRLGSCGNPCLPDSIRIEDGEILARGTHITPGYWRNEAATQEALQDGWLHTGDLGYLDSDDYLFITGRKKEIIVLPNGKKVNPAEMEEKLLALSPDIKDIAVTFKDNLLHALIQPVAGLKEDIPAQQAEYFRWKLLEPYNRMAPPAKRITQLTIMTQDLPKTRLGKVKRHELPALATGTFAAETAPDIPPEDLGPAYLAFEHFLKKELECLRVSPKSHWEMDLALDSLSRLSVLVFIEKTFGVKLPESVFLDYPTVLELANYADSQRTFFREQSSWNSLLQAAPVKEEELELPRSRFIHVFLKEFFGLLLRLAFRVKGEGRENIPPTSCLFVANHQSYIDGLFISMFLKNKVLRRTYYYAKSKHVKPGFLTWLAANCNVIVVKVDQDVHVSLQKVVKAIRQGGNLMIFPEGTRSADGHMGDFKETFAALAVELDIPVVPIAISGAYRALPRGKRLPRFLTRVTVRFLPVISTADAGGEHQLAEQTRESIARNLLQ